jgi:hypothetical protein
MTSIGPKNNYVLCNQATLSQVKINYFHRFIRVFLIDDSEKGYWFIIIVKFTQTGFNHAQFDYDAHP